MFCPHERMCTICMLNAHGGQEGCQIPPNWIWDGFAPLYGGWKSNSAALQQQEQGFQPLSHFSNSRPHLWWSRLALHYFLPVFFVCFFLQITLLSFVCYNLLIWGKSKCFRELCIWECSKINKGCVLCLFLLFYQVPGGDWPIIL